MNPLVIKLGHRDHLLDEEIAVLEDCLLPPRLLKAGQDLVREHDQPKESTLMLTGYSARYNMFEDGRRQITAIHMGGDFIDLHSFLLRPMDHSIVALTDCTVAGMPHESIKMITEQYPHLGRMFWLSTLIDAAIYRRWLVSMGRQSAAAQLAHLLCEFWTRMDVIGLVDDYSFQMPCTQADLADVLGISLVHVNRVVQELRREELVTWSGRKLTILDWNRLTEFAEFDPDYLNLTAAPR